MATRRAVMALAAVTVFAAGMSTIAPAEAQIPDGPTRAVVDSSVVTDPWEVSLVTIGQGRQLWDSFGHNALLIRNVESGRAVAYDWGRFSFDQEGFWTNLLMGRMQYQMGWLDPGRMFTHYEGQDRTVTLQRLNLTPAGKLALIQAIQDNIETPEYRYEYFLNNCSTRVRDLIDQAALGALAQSSSSEEESWRFHTRRLTQHSVPLWAGFDLLLGPRGDVPIQRWDALFTPLELVEQVREAEVDLDGRRVPLVADESVLYTSSREPEPEMPTGRLLFFLVFGCVLGGLLVLLGRASRGTGVGANLARAGSGVVAGAWSGLSGLLGVALIFVMATDHVWMHWNENLFQFSPVSLALAGSLILAPFWERAASAVQPLAATTLVLSVLGLLLQVVPGLDQHNAELIALALPIHLGLYLSVRGRPVRSEQARGGAPAPA